MFAAEMMNKSLCGIGILTRETSQYIITLRWQTFLKIKPAKAIWKPKPNLMWFPQGFACFPLMSTVSDIFKCYHWLKQSCETATRFMNGKGCMCVRLTGCWYHKYKTFKNFRIFLKLTVFTSVSYNIKIQLSTYEAIFHPIFYSQKVDLKNIYIYA